MAIVVSGLHFVPSGKLYWVQFENKTSRSVNILRFDYYDRETKNEMLEPRDIMSFQSHEFDPWICRDAKTKRSLLMNKNELFLPAAAVPDPDTQAEPVPLVVVTISIPLFTLQDIAADTITGCLSRERDIQTLKLPTKFKDVIVTCFKNAHS